MCRSRMSRFGNTLPQLQVTWCSPPGRPRALGPDRGPDRGAAEVATSRVDGEEVEPGAEISGGGNGSIREGGEGPGKQ